MQEGGHLGRVAGQHLRHPRRVVEAHERLGDDEAAPGELAPGIGERDLRLEHRGMVVAEVADDRPAAGLRLLEADEARTAAQEGMTAEPPALDRLEQEARPPAFAQAEVGPERGEEVR